jgi:hypothetical protein
MPHESIKLLHWPSPRRTVPLYRTFGEEQPEGANGSYSDFTHKNN